MTVHEETATTTMRLRKPGSDTNKKGKGESPKHPSFTNEFRTVRLGPVANAVVSVILVVAHVWFLYYLHVEYAALKEKATRARVRDYVILWVPVFLGSILAERLYAWYKKSDVYYLSDSIGNLGTGTLMLLSKRMLGLLVPVFPYMYIWQHFALTQYFAEGGAVAWWVMFLGVEFGYYWAHRTGHTINMFWAMHGIHHSSEEYNLSVALRQSSVHGWFGWVYYLPLALLFPPSLFLIHSQYNLLYQFWIHTPVVNTLGPLEYVLNTPSQHRVHHGKNPYCIDKNYGGTLCVFDRMFNTFQSEIEEVPIVYGTVHPINTFNAVEANVLPWRAIWANMREQKGIMNKLRVLYLGPGWIPGSNPPEEYPIPPTSTDSIVKYRPRLPFGIQVYVTVHFAALVVGLTVGLDFIADQTMWLWLLSGVLLWTYLTIGAICDRKQYGPLLEISRLIAIMLVSAVAFTSYDPSFSVVTDARMWAVYGAIALSVACVVVHRKQITQPIRKNELGDTDYIKAEKDQDIQYQLAGLVPIEPLPATK
eukprot:TRINITY_DN3755_c0_g1_i1.p1 TRINITY_DN3755_c0_g1~~TRINITY_DN3755_c0_g1_i1.p1  ORF type:complete len:534 (-),score=59.71 TRINITY_DN3755_c0_g1_i1:29-1630(-)